MAMPLSPFASVFSLKTKLEKITMKPNVVVSTMKKKKFGFSSFAMKTDDSHESGVLKKKSEDAPLVTTEESEEEGKKIFQSFLDGVVKHLHLPEHTNVVNFKHWFHLSLTSLSEVFPDPTDLYYPTEEEEIKIGVPLQFITKDVQLGEIMLMEKEFTFNWNGKQVDSRKFYHLKQLKLKEEELKKKEAEAEGSA